MLHRYANALDRFVRESSSDLQNLQKVWPAACKAFEAKRRQLLRRIPDDDPLRFSVDLLHPIRCASDEALHSQALSYLLDPSQKHGFGRAALNAMLNLIRAKYPKGGAARVQRRVAKKSVNLTVTPEYRFRIEGMRNRSIARSDIWIEAKVRKRAALIVLENKIGAGESAGQLAWYERKVAAWCKAHGARFLLIFLTVTGGKPKTAKTENWISLSYLELAAALRVVWLENRKSAGAEWLALYIASITQGVLGMRIDKPNGITLAQIKTYLGKAH